MKIMIVDDDPFSLKLMDSIIKKNGHDVECASSAMQALHFLAKNPHIDLIIADIMMPHVDGFAFIRQLYSDRGLCRIPIILCTSLGDPASVVKGTELGIADYIVKPIRASVLMSKVTAVLNRELGAILIVDDEELIRGVLFQILRRDGWNVLSAQNGNEAIDIFVEAKIQLVLSDICMPDMDGFELLSNIKEKSPETPVILMSGRSDYNREEIIATGANDFIAKPFHNTEILACIDAQTRNRRNQSAYTNS